MRSNAENRRLTPRPTDPKWTVRRTSAARSSREATTPLGAVNETAVKAADTPATINAIDTWCDRIPGLCHELSHRTRGGDCPGHKHHPQPPRSGGPGTEWRMRMHLRDLLPHADAKQVRSAIEPVLGYFGFEATLSDWNLIRYGMGINVVEGQREINLGFRTIVWRRCPRTSDLIVNVTVLDVPLVYTVKWRIVELPDRSQIAEVKRVTLHEQRDR